MQIHPLSLRFSDPNTESSYTRSHSRIHSNSSDRFSLLICLPLTLLYLATQTSSSGRILGGLSLSLCLSQWKLMATPSGRFSWYTHREVYVVFFRLGKVIVSICGLCLLPKLTNGESAVEAMLLQSGAMCHCGLALSMPLLVRKHIWVQCLGATGLLAVLGKSVCVEAISIPRRMDATIELWHQLDTFLTTYGFGGHASSIQSIHDREAFTCCVHITTFIHVIIGVVLPSSILWVCEFQARKAYVKKLDQKSNDMKLDLNGMPDTIQIAIVLFSCTSVFWILLRSL